MKKLSKIQDAVVIEASAASIPNDQKRRNLSNPKSRGFALLVALVLMSFMVMLMLSLCVVVQIDTRTAGIAAQEQHARANALLGLQTALGELQRMAGPDTRITARADIYGTPDSSPYRGWIGVWDSQDEDPIEAQSDHTLRRSYQAHADGTKPRPIGWLVSGPNGSHPEDIDPLNINIPSSDQVIFVPAEPAKNMPAIIAGKQSIKQTSTASSGKYAWWVGDEGIKARIDCSDALREENADIDQLLGPSFDIGTNEHKLTLLSSSLGLAPGVEHIDQLWQSLNDSDLKQLYRATSYDSIKVLMKVASTAEERELNSYRHDLTVYSRGLLTDVRKGGFKTDLTMAFENAEAFENFFGIRPIAPTFTNTDREEEKLFNGVMEFPIAEMDAPPTSFYLTPELQKVNKTTDVGPNWGSLFNYYNLYKLDGLTTEGEMNPILGYPKAGGPADVAYSLPYKNYIKYNQPDAQHTNSPVTPILERFQLHIRVGSTSETIDGVEKYKLRFYLQPMLAMWNPYNVKIKRAYPGMDQNDFYPQYRFSFEAAPELVISGEFDDGTPFHETVNIANAYMKGEGNNQYTQGIWAALAPADLDFMPGEIRIMSATAEDTGNFRENELDYGWQDSKGFFFDWPFKNSPQSYRNKHISDKPITIHNVGIKERNDDWFVGGSKGEKLSGAYWKLIHETPSDTNKNNANLTIQSSSGLWKDPYYAANSSNANLSPGTLDDGTIPPFIPSSALDYNYIDIGTWLFHLRTTNEPNNGLRNVIDANPRALYSTPRWDGPSLLALTPFQGGGADQNGYLQPGSVPEPSMGDFNRHTGLNGPSISDYSYGQSHIILFDIPRFPLVSVGQFQHANLSRYNFEPAYLVGNSYANPRIPLNSVTLKNFDGTSGMNLFDTAYMVNDEIFDEYFFSTVDPDIDSTDFQALVNGDKKPYNTRYEITMPTGATRSEIIDFETPTTLRAWGGRFMVNGAFNINSTSVNAWKAILSSMDQPFLRINVDGTDANTLTLTNPNGVYISRTSLPLFENGYTADANDENALKAFFQGYRKLSDSELNDLAEAMVDEVKKRGPFMSMSDFVNRRLNSEDPEQQKRGALQAALDRTINQNISEEIASSSINIPGDIYSETLSNDYPDSQATGANSYVMQGDLLQPLAPILSPRSDTFVIRAYGSSESLSGNSSEAWCEAVVQRFPEMVGTGNDLSNTSLQEFAAESGNLTDLVNQKFGRKFRIVAFKWLSNQEL